MAKQVFKGANLGVEVPTSLGQVLVKPLSFRSFGLVVSEINELIQNNSVVGETFASGNTHKIIDLLTQPFAENLLVSLLSKSTGKDRETLSQELDNLSLLDIVKLLDTIIEVNDLEGLKNSFFHLMENLRKTGQSS